MTDQRRIKLSTFHRVLNTADGQELMKDLRIAWATGVVFNSDTMVMAHYATMLECYRQLESWANGDELNNE